MFDLENEIKKWKIELLKYEVFEDGLIADIELHLRDAYQERRKEGLSEKAAFQAAVSQIGTAQSLSAEYQKNRLVGLNRRSPLRPGRFMPALLWNYIKTSLRAIRRQRGYSFINISGLAIGLAVCMLIVLWVVDEWSFDRFNVNADQIYRVYYDESANREGSTSVLTPPPMAVALQLDFPEIIKATRFGTWQRQLVTYKNKSFNESRFMHVDPDFFTMFSFPLIKGDPETVFSEPYTVVLTEESAAKYFGEEDPIGKTLTVNGSYDVLVTGIIHNESFNSSLEFDLLSPFDILIREYIGEETRENWGFNSFGTYVMLEPSISLENFDRKLTGYLKKLDEELTDELALQPLTDIHLFSNLGHDLSNRGDIKYVWIFSALAVFVLLIAGINFMNLTTARSSNRAKEVGLRKVVGAERIQLIRQFFGESVLMAIFAYCLGLILVELLLPLFNTLSGKEIISAWRNNPVFLIVFFGIAVLTGIFSGSYPALFLSSFKPIQVLRGPLRSAGGNPFFRKALVIFQFSLAVFLIVGTVVISRQLSYMRNKDLGFNREHVIHISIHGELHENYGAIRERFLQNPEVLHVTASMALPTNIQSSPGTPEWEGKNPDEQMEIKADFVDYDYIETFGIPMVEGRSFSRQFATDAETAFIVNEEAVRRMGLQPPVVGRSFGFWGIDGQIIGVMKDAHFQPLHQKIEPLVFKMFPPWLRRMYVNFRSENIPAVLRALEKSWNEMNTGYPFDFRFLDEDFHDLYKAEAKMRGIFRSFASLAVFIACLGLFGLASFMAEQRTKEIGVRRVLGATVSGITLMMSRDFAKWVLIANLIAWPVSWIFINRWLKGFAYRMDMGIMVFLIPALFSIGVALVTVSFQTFRAARSNPVDSLKFE
jgi:putative ABC transport system permease protein